MKSKEKYQGIKIAVLVVILVLGIAYIGVSIYYRMHFYPNTTVGELKVSGMTPVEVEKAITREVDDYKLILKERDGGEEEITGQSVGLVPDYGMTIEEALADQTGFGWVVHLFSERKMERQPVAYDEQKFSQVAETLSCMQQENQQAPRDAYLSYEKGSYSIVPEVYGTTLKEEAFQDTIKQAILDLETTVDLEQAGCYQDPEVFQDDENLNKALNQANVCVKAQITYEAGQQTLQCGADEINAMLTFGEDGSVDINGEALSSFITRVDNTFSTLGKDKKFKTSYGKTVTISRSDYGWKVDSQAEAEALQQAILSGTVETREPIFSQKAASYGTYDYGNSYVEINLTAQHLFLYDKGKLVLETDFVSGNESNGNATRLGMMRLKYKQEDAVLRGEDYETPVKYWMPFDGNIGMHDATWRSKFGGDIYKTKGSHGCINLPLSAAKKIFETIQPGEPVMVYKLKGTEPKEPEEKEETDSTKKDKNTKTDKKDTTTQSDKEKSEDSKKQN